MGIATVTEETSAHFRYAYRVPVPVPAHETLQQRLASDIARSALRGSPQLDKPLPEQLLFQFSGPLLRSLLLGLRFHGT